MTVRRRNLWGWLILIAMGILLGVSGHYSFSVRDHNLFLMALILLSIALVGLFTLLYSQNHKEEKSLTSSPVARY